MRILSAPRDSITESSAGFDVPVVLYSQANTPDEASIGASVLQRLRRKKLAPANRAWDLLSIALSVIAADTAVRRSSSPDGWTRQLDLSIAVHDPDFWSSQKDLLERQLRFLTTDLWSVEFIEGGVLPAPPKRTPLVPDEDSVCLLSGGLDSLVGAVDLTSHARQNPFLVSQVSKGDKQKQSCFASKIGGGLQRLELNHNFRCSWQNERTQRARSIIFLAYGVLLASALRPYREGETLTLYVCENGFISINPSLTTGRVGSLSTKTTHPVFLALFQELLNAAGLRVTIKNPYQLKTKGEMLAECVDQAFLMRYAAGTTSCGRFGRYNYRHCGRCVPCLIRRAAFHAWGRADRTDYVYKKLSINNTDYARFDDVRSAAMAVAEAREEGFDRWVRPRLSAFALGDTSSYKEVVRRGLKELEVFLQAEGVK